MNRVAAAVRRHHVLVALFSAVLAGLVGTGLVTAGVPFPYAVVVGLSGAMPGIGLTMVPSRLDAYVGSNGDKRLAAAAVAIAGGGLLLGGGGVAATLAFAPGLPTDFVAYLATFTGGSVAYAVRMGTAGASRPA